MGISPDLPQDMLVSASALISASLSRATWKKYSSARNLLSTCLTSMDRTISWPISKSDLRIFVTWCFSHRHLSPASVREYVSGLKALHSLEDLDTKVFDDNITKAIINGASHLHPKPVSRRRSMSIPLLKILVSRISSSSLPDLQKKLAVFLAVAGFMGGFRLGELLAPRRFDFDPGSTCLYNDISVRQEFISVTIKSPKVSKAGQDVIDLFRANTDSLCPVKAFLDLRQVSMEAGIHGMNRPLAEIRHGEFWTTRAFNEILKVMLSPVIDWSIHQISCHLFRPGIPCSLQRSSDQSKADQANLHSWGRWSSSAINRYRRQTLAQNRANFAAISSSLNL